MNSLLKTDKYSSVDILLLIKLIVYSLLLINFVWYIRDDWVIASFTMRNGGSVLDWTRAYAATIDVAAWIVLIIVFELETYTLSDEAFTRNRVLLMHGTRFICYGFICHSLYAYGIYLYELSGVSAIPDANNLCQLIGLNVSFASNLLYTDLDASNCSNLSSASQFFYIDPPDFIIVTDGAGLTIERHLAWIDFLEVVVWLLILFTIEVVIRLQDRDITSGYLISGLNSMKLLLYSLLWVAIFYWLYRGHIMFGWDEFVWIAGFILIEANVAKWRQEIIETGEAPVSETTPG